MTFLSVVTRVHPSRPQALAENVASVEAQTDRDWEQLLIFDLDGHGVHEANKSLADLRPVGDYVLVLDDDDVFTDPEAVAALKMVTQERPELVIFRCDHGLLGVLPSSAVWERRPLHGHIGSCDFVTRLDVWNEHIHAFGAPEGGDYWFLRAIWHHAPDVVWFDRQLTAVQRISKGRGE